MRVLVVYESRGGRTAKTASAIAEVLRGDGHDVVLASVADAQPADATTADLVVVGSCTEGFILFGVGPAKAARAWLERLPSLEGRRAAVFCTYAVHPGGTLDAMASRLTARGATVVARRAVHRRDPLAGIKLSPQLVATDGNGFGLFLRFLRSLDLPTVATGCPR